MNCFRLFFVSANFSLALFHSAAAAANPGEEQRPSWFREHPLVDDKELEEFLTRDASDEHRELQESTGGLFDACNDDNACQEEEGFTCVLWVTRKRCVPLDCLRDELTSFHNSFQQSEYVQNLRAEAGMERGSWPGGFRNSDKRASMLSALSNNTDFPAQIENIGKKCFFGDADYNTTTADGKQLSLSWSGVQVEAGLILPDFQYAEYRSPVDDFSATMQRYCVGAELGASCGFTPLAGFGWTAIGGSPKELLSCGYLMADLDVGLFFGAGIAVGVTFSGVIFFEYEVFPSEGFSIVLGAGAGVAVCGACIP
ncbi:unknown protein [Seminavis robusta]|uniref:Uncharacterized protein n=1 Tax=Seminavis robusta TaxID=568900 RepID=A0A9N8H4K3_9STRA|nr:unknown protein [Seminavis robusta]|eukprot:Sro86_g045660.1 n/a (312) ;mRNA; r:37848-38783